MVSKKSGQVSLKMRQASSKIGQKEQLLLFFFEYPQLVLRVCDFCGSVRV